VITDTNRTAILKLFNFILTVRVSLLAHYRALLEKWPPAIRARVDHKEYGMIYRRPGFLAGI